MIISDLNHLEVVSEASSVVGGDGKWNKKFKLVDIDITKQSNISVINQNAEAAALSVKGDAKATASNTAVVFQSNS